MLDPWLAGCLRPCRGDKSPAISLCTSRRPPLTHPLAVRQRAAETLAGGRVCRAKLMAKVPPQIAYYRTQITDRILLTTDHRSHVAHHRSQIARSFLHSPQITHCAADHRSLIAYASPKITDRILHTCGPRSQIADHIFIAALAGKQKKHRVHYLQISRIQQHY